MNIFIVIYHDWGCEYQIKGVFTNKDQAELCEKYCWKLIEMEDKESGPFGRYVGVRVFDCLDDVDFVSRIKELEERERRKQQKKEDEIREADMAEFNRIKQKYGL